MSYETNALSNDELNIKGKVALVTGASKGIGRSIALLLASYGAIVVANYNSSKDEAEKLEAELQKKSPGSACIKCDIGNTEEVKKLFASINEKFKKLDILVNNAGIFKESFMLMTREEDYDEVMRINLKGSYVCMQHAAKLMMRQRSGKIINMSSIVGVDGAKGQTHYAASKAGIIGLTKSAAKELAQMGITVNAIAPGFIDTEMITGYKGESRKKVIGNIALGRIGKPDDVAKVMLFLASSLSDYVTGQVIGVDGGMTL